MNDQEYLQKAGINEEGEKPIVGADSASHPSSPEAPGEVYEVGEYKLPAAAEFKLTQDGKIVKVPVSQMINKYRLASHIENKYQNEYKPKIDAFESQRADFDRFKGFYDKYGAMQEWSEKNPKDWDVLNNLYKNRDAHILNARAQGMQNPELPGSQNPNLKPVIDEISQLKNDLMGLKEVKTQWESQQEKAKMEADTNYVLNEKATFQKEHPEINLEERDPDGVALWAKVMKFGIEKRYPDFESAARVYLKDVLSETYSSRARNEAVKGLKSDHKAGIVKRSLTPFSGQKETSVDPKKLSYAQMAEMFKSGQFAEA